MEIGFDGTYDRKTFERALGMLERRSLLQKIIRWLALPLLLFSLGMGVYQWLQEGASAAGLSKLARPVFLALLLGYYYLGPYISRWSRTRALFKESASRRMLGQAGLEGITVGPIAGRRVLFKWDGFIRKTRQDPLLALLMVDGTMALFTRNFFQSDADWSRFLQLVEQRVIEPK